MAAETEEVMVGTSLSINPSFLFAPGAQTKTEPGRQRHVSTRSLLAITLALAMLATALQFAPSGGAASSVTTSPTTPQITTVEEALAASTGTTVTALSATEASTLGDLVDVGTLTVGDIASIEAQMAAADAVTPLVDAVQETATASAATDTMITMTDERFSASVMDSVASLDLNSSATAGIATASIAGVTGATGITITDGVRQATDFGVATAWWQPLENGLEQGWTFPVEPAGANGILAIDVQVTGDLTPTTISDTIIRLDAADPADTLWYRDLLAWDANDTILPATMSAAGDMIAITVDATNAAYPVTVDPIITADDELLPLPSSAQDRFGTAAAVDGNLAVITAPGEDVISPNGGSAQVFQAPFTTSVQLQTWYPQESLQNGSYGASADIAGDLMVIGAPTADENGPESGGIAIHYWDAGANSFAVQNPAYACDASAGSCNARLTSAGFDNANFGADLQFGGNGGIVSAPGIDKAFFVKVDISGDTVDIAAEFPAEPGTAEFATSVAITDDGDHVAIGAVDTAGSGVVYVYEAGAGPAGAFGLVETLTSPSTAGSGGDNFGASLDFANGYLAVGQPDIGEVTVWSATTSGSAFDAFVATGATITGAAPGDQTGTTVAFAPIDANSAVLVVGRTAPGNSARSYGVDTTSPTTPIITFEDGFGLVTNEVGGVATDGVTMISGSPTAATTNVNELTLETDEGAAAIQPFGGTARLIRPDNNNQFDRLGTSADIEGNVLAVGATGQDTAGDNAGAVYMYQRTAPGAPWDLYDVIDAPVADHEFGISVSVSGGRVAVGAPSDTDVNNRVFVFEDDGTEYVEVPIDPFTTPPSLASEYGKVVSLADNGRLLFVGAPGDDAVYVHEESLGASVSGFPEATAPTTGVGGDALASALVPGDLFVTLIIGDIDGTEIEFWRHTPGSGESITQSGANTLGFSPGFGSAVAIDPATGDWAGASSTTGEFVIGSPGGEVRYSSIGGFDYDTGFEDSANVIDLADGIAALGSPLNGGEVLLFDYDLTAPGTEILPGSYEAIQLSSRQPGDLMGYAVALDGSSLVMGAPNDGDASQGAAFAFENITGPAPLEKEAVADVDGSWGAISLVGQNISIYQQDQTTGNWSSFQTLADPAGSSAAYGYSIAISERYLAVGDPEARAVYLFVRNDDGEYELVETIASPVTDTGSDQFGISVDLSNTWLVVGAPKRAFSLFNGSGAWAYELSQSTTPGTVGSPEGIYCFASAGVFTNNGCGTSVAVSDSDDIMLIGAPLDDVTSLDGGAVYFAEFFPALGWSDGSAIPSFPDAGDLLGSAVATDGVSGFGESAIVGAPGANGGNGAAYIVNGAGALTLLASGTNGEQLGQSVDASGDYVATGGLTTGWRLFLNDDDTGFSQVDTFGGAVTDLMDVNIDSSSIITAYSNSLFQASQLTSPIFSSGVVTAPANKLLAQNGSELDRFGQATAIDGDTLVVASLAADGDFEETKRATVYVFKDVGGTWTFDQRILFAFDEPVEDIALNGDLLVVGGSSNFALYQRFGSAPFNTVPQITGPAGGGVAIGGDYADGSATVAVGRPDAAPSAGVFGVVDLYVEVTDIVLEAFVWILVDTIESSLTDQLGSFGTSVAASDDWLVVASPEPIAGPAGGGRVFVYPSNGIGYELAPSFTLNGDDDPFDIFGADVDIDGDAIIISSPGVEKTFAFNYDGTSWVASTLPTPTGTTTAASPQAAVAVSGDVAVVGHVANNSFTAYGYDGTSWVETQGPIVAADAENADSLGFALGLDGTTVIAGAPTEDQNGNSAGAAYTFTVPNAPAAGPNLIAEITNSGAGSFDYNEILADFDVSITNIGDTAVGSDTTLTVRFSEDAIFDSGDFELLAGEAINVATNGLASGASITENLSAVTADPSVATGPLPTGPGFLVVSIDTGNVVTESDETDNTDFTPVTFGAESPTLSFAFDLDSSEPASVPVAPGGIDASLFDARVLEQAADDETSVAAAPLSATPLSATPLSATPLSATPLSAIIIDSAPLSATSLVDVDIEGGWEAIIAGSALEDIPVVDLTLGQVMNDPAALVKFGQKSIASISVLGSPLSAIPLSATVLGSTELTDIPLSATDLDSDAAWCDVLLTYLGIVCDAAATELEGRTLMEIALRGVPLSAIPLSAIPLSAIPLSATPLSATTMGELNLASTPLSAIPLSAIPLSATDLTDTPLSATPLSAIPLSAIPLSAIPLSAIDLIDIDVAGAELAEIPLSGIPLSAIELSATPLSATPLSATPLSATPLSATPLSAILLAETPLSAIPLSATPLSATQIEEQWCAVLADVGNGYDCEIGVDLDETTVLGLALQGIPLSAIPLSATPLAAIPLSATPLAAIPLSATPLSAIPLSAIDLDDVDLDTTPLSATPLSGTLLADVPLSAIDIAGSPLSAIPLSATPLAAIPLSATPAESTPLSATPLSATPLSAIPLSAIPLSAIPLSAIGTVEASLGSTPLSAIDVNGSPLSATPLSAIDVFNTPLSAIPLSAIPLSAISYTDLGIDCTKVDCDIDTLGDALAAGTLDTSTQLSEIFHLLDGISVGDIADAIAGATPADFDFGSLDLGDLNDLSEMVLGDIPSDRPELALTTLSDIAALLASVAYTDLIGAIIDPATGMPFPDADVEGALRNAIDGVGANADELLVTGDVTLGDLVDSSGSVSVTMEFVESLLGLMNVQDLLDAFTPPATLIGELDLELGDLTVRELQGLTLGDLIEDGAFQALTAAQVFDALSAAGLLEGFTFGDLLLSVVGEGDWPFAGLTSPKSTWATCLTASSRM